MAKEEKNRSFFKETTYEDFRKFLKTNFYYCTLSSEQQAQYTKSFGTTRYNEFKNIIEWIDNGKINFPKFNKKKAFKYEVDQFDDYNVFANSYQLKNFTASETCITLFILLMLAEKNMTMEQIINSDDAGIEKQTITDKVKFMYESGMIGKNGKKYFFEESFFYSIDKGLLLKLLNMTDFMKNLVYPELSGYNLFNILKNIYEEKTGEKYTSPFQLKNSYLANILDDNVLWTLLDAIENRNLVSFTYNDAKKEKIIPVRIFTENDHNRTYIFAVKRFYSSYKIFIFRLSRIYDLKIMRKEETVSEKEFEEYLEKYKSEKEYSFLGKMDSSKNTDTLEIKYKKKMKEQLKRDFECIEFGKNNTATVTVKNKKMMIPYLRANMGLIETTNEEISGKIKSEIEEMKKIYGIIS